MNIEEKELFEEYRDNLTKTLYITDVDKWPVRSGRVTPLFLDIFTKELLNDLDILKKQKTNGEIARLLTNPTFIVKLSYYILKGMRELGYTKEEQRNKMLFLFSLAKELKKGSLFNSNRKNIILSEEELAKILHTKLIKANTEDSGNLHKFFSVLWAYLETIYFINHVSCEIHGPYVYENSKYILRDYFNLRPIDLWEECNEFPYENISVITKYKDTDLTFDLFNNSFPTKLNLVDNLSEYSVLADGKEIDIEEITNLTKILSNIIQNITKKVDSFSSQELAIRYAEASYWYRVKQVKAALNKDWKLGEEALNKIKKGNILPPFEKNESLEDLKKKFDLTK